MIITTFIEGKFHRIATLRLYLLYFLFFVFLENSNRFHLYNTWRFTKM